MGACGSSRDEEDASDNNVFRQEVDDYILAEEPQGILPSSEVARQSLSRSLHAHFVRKNILLKVWRAYSTESDISSISTMSYLQLQTMIKDILVCDKDKDRILHERHMTGDLAEHASNPLTGPLTSHTNALSVGLRHSKEKFSGYLNTRNAKITKLLTEKNEQIIKIYKKLFKALDGRLEPEIAITERVFVARFKLDMLIDMIKVKGIR